MSSGKTFSMMDFIKDICENIGPRLGTTENEKKAGLQIKDIMEKFADTVDLEDFSCHPKGFLEFIKVAFIAGLIGLLLFFWFPLISMLLTLYAVSTFIMEQMLLKEYVDFLFPKRTGTNVIGKLKAADENKKIIIFSGHHDSAYEFPLFDKYREKFGILTYTTAGLLLISVITALLKFIFDILGISDIVSNTVFLLFPIVALILGGYIAFNLHSKVVILGANDNLSGVAVTLALAEYFARNRPRNIELWFISFACEECMRGSKRFVKRHKTELTSSQTINFDMVGCGNVSIIYKEPEFTSKHSEELVKEYQASSKNANMELPIKVMKFGGTDAANFSKAGLKAISVLGLTPHGYPDTWHVVKDTPDNLEEVLLEKTVKISIQYIQDLDSKL